MNSIVFLNAILFQCVWWAQVYSLWIKIEWIGAIVFVLFVLLNWCFVFKKRSLEMIQWSAVGLIGWGFDLFLMQLKVFQTTDPTFPLWLLFIWISFVATWKYSLRKLLKNPSLAFLLGAVFGPLSYWSGSKLGVLSYTSDVQLIALHCLHWGAILTMASLLIDLESFNSEEGCFNDKTN